MWTSSLKYISRCSTLSSSSVNPPHKQLIKSLPSCLTKNHDVNGLLSNGGPSTDVFIKMFGKEKTTYLYKNILFGTKK